jgi:glutamate dehydrogenase/leucine dehydrogenase
LKNRNIIGAHLDIPAPDVNTNAKKMAWFIDEYLKASIEKEDSSDWLTDDTELTNKIINDFQPLNKQTSFPVETPYLDKCMTILEKHPEIKCQALAVVTGKPDDKGGSLGRAESTGLGVFVALRKAAKYKNINLQGATAAIQGFGNVGRPPAKFLHDAGVKVVAITDAKGGIYNPNGLDIEAVFNYVNTAGKGSIKGFHGAREITNEGLFAIDVDFLILAALENAIDRNAYKVKARIIVEGANGPITPGGDKILKRKGVFIAPDIGTNLGGVFVSYLEWVQNLKNERWDLKKINDMLEDNVSMVFNDILRISQERKIDMRTAANIIAVGRVAVAELSKEIVNMMIISSSSPLAKGGRGDYMTEETLNTLRGYLIYLCDDLMKRIPLDYWTLVVLISNLERVLNTSKIIGGDIGVIVKDIYMEAIRLFASFVKAKPENGDLLTAMSTLPESARKQF